MRRMLHACALATVLGALPLPAYAESPKTGKELEELSMSSFHVEGPGIDLYIIVLGWNNRRIKREERGIINEAIFACVDDVARPSRRAERREVGTTSMMISCLRKQFSTQERYLRRGYFVVRFPTD